MSSENQKKVVDTYVLAINAAGAPELLYFGLEVTQSAYDDGAHYDAAKDLAERAGYTPRGAFDQNDPAARRLPELAAIQTCSEARHQAEQLPSGAPLVYIQAGAAAEDSDAPSYGSFRADEAFRQNLLRLKDLCEVHGLSEIRVRSGCDWGPGDIEDELRLQGDELVVAGDMFWFVTQPKHADYHVETTWQSVNEFVEATRQHVGEDPLRYGDLDDDEWEELLSDSVEHDDEKEVESEGAYDGEEERAEAAYLQQQRDRADQFTAPGEDEPDPGLEDELESMRP